MMELGYDGGKICLKMPEKKSNREKPLKGIIAGRKLLKRSGQARDSDVKSSGP